jgi:hypothetical protein
MGRAGAALCAALLLWTSVASAQLERFSRADATNALRAALEQGSQAAVKALGRTDGFLGNARVRIPLPRSAQRAEKLMRRFGMGEQADELIVTLNRAAEQAVPEARELLLQSVRKMSVRDAKQILSGGDTAATDYFRRTTRSALHGRFLPIVRQATGRVRLAQAYARYAQPAASLGLLSKEDADLDEYVTQKALDGLYLMVAEEEKKLRAHPVEAGSRLLREVLGALR